MEPRVAGWPLLDVLRDRLHDRFVPRPSGIGFDMLEGRAGPTNLTLLQEDAPARLTAHLLSEHYESFA
jgi:hypothetical protein